MPSFESILVGGCPGFAQKCLTSNHVLLSTDDTEPFRIMAASLVAPSSSSSIKHSKSFNDVMECFVYIFESYRRATDQPDLDISSLSSILQQNTVLSPAIISILVEHLSKIVKTTSATEKKRIHRIGQMVDFKWRLGVAITSNSCRDLQNPYVVVSFAVVESDGSKKYHSAELTLEQFQVNQFVSISLYLVDPLTPFACFTLSLSLNSCS